MTRKTELYLSKPRDYFGNSRREILPLLPEKVGSIFEFGCGSGDTLSFLKSNGTCEWAGGVELFPDAARRAREKGLDLVIEGDLESVDIPIGRNSLDVILCLDVLEHLSDPWRTVELLTNFLKPGGSVIISIPNVRHHSVVVPLLTRGAWEYADQGLLDRTHLRFFTKKTAVELAQSSGLTVLQIKSTGIRGRAAFANACTLGLLRPFFEVQYLLRAAKTQS
jgi:2-polyprenyl-3-methyl-5-hydroxy-6-metoxy-1,4-benzoquinol methylase